MSDPSRYDPVAQALPYTLPPITRIESERAAYRLKKKFGKQEDASPNVTWDYHAKPGLSRRVWISHAPTTGHFKGWGRLIHDVSHTIFRYRHPSFRPHDGGHAALEREMAEYVVAMGWLNGTLKPAAKAKPTMQDKRRQKVERLLAWQKKEQRAKNAIRKLTRQIRAMARREEKSCATDSDATA